MDTETETQIHAALEQLRQNRTTFIIAHRIQTVMQADKILVLDKGRIVQQGSHRELVAQEGIYRRIYELQAQIGQDAESVAERDGQDADDRITTPISGKSADGQGDGGSNGKVK